MSDTKSKIEHAALTLFVERGVGYASIKEIAALAGVAQGALYRHWVSKEALVDDLFCRHYLGLTVTLENAMSGITGFPERIAACCTVFCRLFDDDPILFSFLLLSQHNGLRSLPAGARTPVDVIEDVVAAGQAAGDIPSGHTAARAAAAMGVVLQTATFRAYGRITGSLCAHRDRLAAAAVAAARA